MSEKKLPPHYGHGVSDDRFWPRAELNLILRRLRLGNSVSVFGLRRNGKTSLLKESARILREKDQLTVIEIDGQGMDAVGSLFSRIVTSLPDAPFKTFRLHLENFKIPPKVIQIIDLWRGRSREDQQDAALITRHWTSLAQLVAQIIPTMEPHPVLIIDEITYLCEDLHKQEGSSSAVVSRLLAMLREWREAGMAIAIAGSIGIRQYLRTIDVSLNLLNGIISIPLQAMTSDAAKSMLAALARHQSMDWWDEQVSIAVIENSADLTQAAMQFAFDHVVPAVEESGDSSRSAIDALFRDVIRPHFDHEFYQQFDERLDDYSDLDQRMIHGLFNAITRSQKEQKSRSSRELEKAALKAVDPEHQASIEFDALLRALAEDGFLIDNQDSIRFANNMVLGWWQIRDHRRGRRHFIRVKR